MPELPEVENVRRTLAARLVGRSIVTVQVRRASVVHGRADAAALLAGSRVRTVERLGKQLAVLADAGVLCVHLGMTGSLRYTTAADASAPKTAPSTPVLSVSRRAGSEAVRSLAARSGPSLRSEPALGEAEHAISDPHLHLLWQLDDGGQLAFRDPRRFGGVWTFPDAQTLRTARWQALGEDALTIPPARLHAQLLRTRRPIKAALLDQNLVAGLGNIYVDELLFACRLHPLRPADTLERAEVADLVRRMRGLLSRAIAAGGSTLRDYVDADGQRGGFQQRHQVYSRAGQPCRHCEAELTATVVTGRTTVFCPRCQAWENF